MVFDNLFSSARGTSSIGSDALSSVAGYIPKEPAESVCVPPHDPSKKRQASPQDPKIVRETSPGGKVVFDFIDKLTHSIAETAKQQNEAFNDPSTTVGSASPVTDKANNETKAYPQSTSKPKVDVNEFLEASQKFTEAAKETFPKK